MLYSSTVSEGNFVGTCTCGYCISFQTVPIVAATGHVLHLNFAFWFRFLLSALCAVHAPYASHQPKVGDIHHVIISTAVALFSHVYSHSQFRHIWTCACLGHLFFWCMQGLSQVDREHLKSKLSAKDFNRTEDCRQREPQFTDEGKCGKCSSVLFSCCCGQVSDVSMDQHH